MSELVAYDCPTCTEEIAIEPHLFGEVVKCPKCTHAFQVKPPIAEPKDVQPTEQAEGSAISRSADHESTLRTVHPAVMRSRPFYFTLLLAMLVVGSAASVYFFFFTQDGWLGATAGGIAALVGATILLAWWIQALTVTLTVSSKRTRLRAGLFSKSTSEVQHDDVRNLQVDQSLIDRLLGIGTLSISSSGQDDLEIIARNIPAPNELADLIRARQ